MKTIKISKEIELIFGSFGAIQSTFLMTYLFFGKKRNIPNILLSIFFFLISIRIIKSLLWVYIDTLPDWFLNIGFIAHYATGPSLFLYFLYFIKSRKWVLVNYLHFIPPLLLIPFIFNINGENFWHLGGYSFLLYHQLTYTVVTLMLLLQFLFRKNNTNSILDKRNDFGSHFCL